MRAPHPSSPALRFTSWLPSRGACLASLACAPLLAACSASLAPAAGDSVERDAAEGAASAALVVVERTVRADESVHGSAVARFVRMRTGAIDDETLRMLGATLSLPPLGTCSAAGATDEAFDARRDLPSTGSLTSGGPRAVELLDVGSLALEANGVRSSLEARALPDIVDLVTGVLYSAQTALTFAATATPNAPPSGRTGVVEADGPVDAVAASIPGRASYVLRATGSTGSAVPAFSVAADAPGEPDELRIDGQDARAIEGVVLAAGGRVELSWATLATSLDPSKSSEPDDLVYVDLVPRGDGGGSSVRCLFADRGAATLPTAAFETLGAGHGVLVVHRVHRETFQIGGIDSGVIRFDFARAAEFTRR